MRGKLDIFDKQDKNIVEEIPVSDNSEYASFLKDGNNGILVVHEKYRNSDEIVAQPDSGQFIKWIRINHPEIKVEEQLYEKRLVLHSNEYWLPVVFLASDVTLPIYLNLVASYLYDMSKGLLKGENQRIHFSAVYEDKKKGITKRINFDGDENSLQKTIKRFDVNQFMNY